MPCPPRYLVYLSVSLLFAACTDINAPPAPIDERPQFIVNGVLDGDDHPNAGAFLRDRNGNGQPDPITEGSCSGSLIAPTVFLTAGHCLGGPPPPLVQYWVSFASEGFTGTPEFIPVTEIHRHPDFGRGNDMGVMLLEYAPDGIDPVELPKHKLLEKLFGDADDDDGDEDGEEDEEDEADDDDPSDQHFVVVGYGVTLTPGPGAICIPVFVGPTCGWVDGRRRAATVAFVALDPLELFVGPSADHGNGNACGGDSGAPIFLGHSNVVVAVASGVVGWPVNFCQGIGFNSRLDTKAARKFLKPFLKEKKTKS